MICPLHFVVLGPEPPELPDDLVVPAGLAVDREEERVERENGTEQDSQYFGVHGVCLL